MNKRMLDWIAERLSHGLTGESRVVFLRHLENGDNRLYRFVESNLMDWQTLACAELKESFWSYDPVESSKEIISHWRQFFIKELADMN